MTADVTHYTAGLTGVPDAEIARLAARAIAVLLSERGARDAVIEARLELLSEAFLSDREETRHAIVARMRQDGISVNDIIDVVLPEVARAAGRRWLADDISFAEVTIVAARLQEMVGALGRGSRRPDRDRPDRDPDRNVKRILLVIPRSEHHTFGTFVAADQIRRAGFVVDIAIDLTNRQIGEKVRKTRYHMVGLTASSRRTLASARDLVDTIRASVTRVTPIVLGGNVTDLGENLKSLTGVDHVAQDVPTALAVCGLMVGIKEAVHGAP